MPAVDYAPNTPRWVDLGSSDVAGAKRFYSELFGWDADTMEDPNAGGYTIFKQGDKSIAGLGPLQMEGQPTAWATYVYVDDAKAVADKVAAGGGSTLVPPMDVMGQGTMAVFMDPQGGAFCVWQPAEHTGADLFNEPVSLAWNEYATRDVDKAKSFYGAVFGWDGDTHAWGPTTYTEFKAADKVIAGMREMGAMDPAEMPPHWLAYFSVADTDATVAKATALGGKVLAPAMDIDAGRFAVLADPQGAVFAVIATPSAAG